MATAAQIAANRRNALKSTGPRTEAGKARSSRNAVTYGMNEAATLEQTAAFFEATRAAAGGAYEVGWASDRADALALRLARAEVQMCAARRWASNALAKGDDYLRLKPEIDMILDALAEDGIIWQPMTPAARAQGIRMLIRLATFGRKSARRTYRRMLRHLRDAEATHEHALRDWLDLLEANFKTKPIST